MGTDDLIHKLDPQKRDEMILECMVSLLAQSSLMFKFYTNLSKELATIYVLGQEEVHL
jgi:hypothetical protein